MKRGIALFLALAATVSVAWAADDPIMARQALMKANGEALKPVIPILKGGDFDLAAVQKALNTFIEASEKAPALFPAGSDQGKTNALPAIWTDTADFDARFVKLGADSKAALAAITDKASFMANFPGVLKNCGGCHEKYRAKQQ
jgi:cytochrome c556